MNTYRIQIAGQTSGTRTINNYYIKQDTWTGALRQAVKEHLNIIAELIDAQAVYHINRITIRKEQP